MGLRADYFKMLDNLAFSPRISAAYDIRHGGTITGGFGTYHQFPSDMPSLTYQYLANSGLTSDSVEAVETRLLSPDAAAAVLGNLNRLRQNAFKRRRGQVRALLQMV